MRGVPEEALRAWRGAHARLSRPARDLDEALGSMLPPPCAPSTYASLFARIDAFDPAQIDERAFRGGALRVFPLEHGGHALLPFEVLPALLALRRFADASRVRRSSVQRRIEERLAAAAEGLRATLSARPASVAELEGAPGAAEAARALDWLARRGEAVIGRDPPTLFGEPTYAAPRAADAVRPAPPDGFRFLQDVAIAYFGAAGPAARDDFLWWAGLSRSAARHTIEDLVGLIEEVDVEGERKAQFMLEDDAADLRGARAPPLLRACFLPSADPAGASSRAGFAPLCERRLRPKLIPGGRARPRPVVVVGGSAVAAWGWSPQRGTVEVAPAKELSQAAEAEVGAARDRLVEFVEGPLARRPGAPTTTRALFASLGGGFPPASIEENA